MMSEVPDAPDLQDVDVAAGSPDDARAGTMTDGPATDGPFPEGRALRSDVTSGRFVRWGLPASVAVHLVVVAILLITLPVPENKAPDEPVVDVEIVPPPEEEQAQSEEQLAPETVEEEQKAEEPEEAPQQEEEQAAEEQAAPEEPESEPPAAEEPEAQEPEVQEPQAEEQPTPEPEQVEPEQAPEPEETEEAQPEEQPEPEPEQAEEPDQSTEVAQEPAGGEQGQSEIETLRPVFEFGEEDSGPREQLDGNSSDDGGLVEDAPEDIASPFEELTANVPTPSARPSDAPRISVSPNANLPEAKRLFSTEATGSQAAITAMANMPRANRGADLCATELREQLRNGTPAYWPELLPAYELPENTTIIDVDNGAFRAQGAWYNLAFRCELDADVRKVVSFAIKVGDPIPRNQWQARGFPSF